MPAFTDKNGREWKIDLCGPSIEEVLKRTEDVATTLPDGKTVKGIDLGDDGASGLLALAKSGSLVVRVAWILCSKQAKEDSISAELFGRAFDGTTIEAAETAIREAQELFTRPSRRCFLRGILDASDREMKAAQEETLAGIADPETARRTREAFKLRITSEIDQALVRVSSAANSPEKSE